MKRRALPLALVFILLLCALPCAALGERAAAASSTGAAWDLTKMYADAAAFDAELERANTALLPEFEKRARAISDADSALFLFKAYDEMQAAYDDLNNYALCAYYRDFSDSAAQARFSAVNDLQQRMALLIAVAENALADQGDGFFEAPLSDERFAPWHRQLAHIRSGAAHRLSEADAALVQPATLAMTQLSTISATLLESDMHYETFENADGDAVKANYVNNFAVQTSADRDLRKRARNAFMRSLTAYTGTFSGIYDSFFKLSESDAEIRHYDDALDSAMRGYELTSADFYALLNSAKAHSGLEARYNALRKKALGLDELYGWDMNVAICETPDIVYGFADAEALILTALAPLGEGYLAYVRKIFDEGWIDADPGDGKFSGAFSTMGYKIDPRVLVNFVGDYSSVSALAHELGHAVHNLYINDNQSSYYNAYPSNMEAEVASTTNELLLARYMQTHAATEEERLYYLLCELDTYSLSFFTCIARSAFEADMHEIVRGGGTLTADIMNKAYCRSMDAFSPGIASEDRMNPSWTYISQYFTPYYNCAYAFASAAACGAAQGILDGTGTENYLTFLGAGNSLPAREQFALMGANLGTPEYAQPLYDRYNEILDEAEKLMS